MRHIAKTSVRRLTRGALVAALYVLLTFLSALFGLSGGVVQFRLSEALTVLPALFPEAVVGLTLGCFLADLLTGAALYDCIFGSLATLVAALLTFVLGKLLKKANGALKNFLFGTPAVIVNALVIAAILKSVYAIEGGYLLLALSVALGEFVCAVLLGGLLLTALEKRKIPFLTK